MDQNSSYYQGEDLPDDFSDLEQDAIYVVPKENILHAAANEPHKRFIPVVTIIIIVANIIAGIMCIGAKDYIHTGGLNYQYITLNKEYGRLLSHMFLHGSIEHLFSNMIALLMAGYYVEKLLGPLQTMIIYFGSGVGSAIISMFIKSITAPDSMSFSIGASGAVFGMMCAMLFSSAMKKRNISRREIVSIIVLIIIDIVASSGENVDNVAHVCGAVVGGILAFLLNIKKWTGFRENKFLRLLAVILTVGLCVTGIGEADIGKPVTYLPDKKIDYVKAQKIIEGNDTTFGDGLDSFCTDETWQAFNSTDGNQIVEFNGNAVYKGRQVAVLIQFKVTGDCEDFVIGYFGIDDQAQGVKVVTDFLLKVCGEQ